MLEHFCLTTYTWGVNKITIMNALSGRQYLSNSKLLVVRIMCTVHAVSTPVSGHPLIRVLSSLRSYGNNFLGYLERHFYPLVAVVHSSRPCSNEPVNKGGYLVKKSYMYSPFMVINPASVGRWNKKIWYQTRWQGKNYHSKQTTKLTHQE